MYKKVDFDEEILEIRRKGIATFTGFHSDQKIIITFDNGEMNEYYFTNSSEYNRFNRKLRKLYQGMI
jgi:hypothetical protein